MESSTTTPLNLLLARREEFVGFLASRLGGNHADAEDVLQHGLVKAMAAAPELREQERLVPWFYQILRHALVDHVRTRRAGEARDQRWVEETNLLAPDPAETARHFCQCLEPLLCTLPSNQAALIQRVNLGGEPVYRVATALGLQPNAASVALHRGRITLRLKLQSFCGDCASGFCLDCDCDSVTDDKLDSEKKGV
jgi:RNA polymerase sigma factor (sigma-70 family)